MSRVLILLSVILFSVYVTEQTNFLQEDFINKINQNAKTWKAGVNFHPSTPKKYILRLLGTKKVQIPTHHNAHLYKANDVAYNKFYDRIPRQFDARKKWRQCITIGEVRNQGNCGSCWALATSSAFSDRMCIASEGEFNQMLSAEELTFCCRLCGNGCDGGIPLNAWGYFKRHGLVTGGAYNTTDGCEPYRVPPCNHVEHVNGSCHDLPDEPKHKCTKKCYGNEEVSYSLDHRYTRDHYYLTYQSIQKDVMVYGPVVASFTVYDDFMSYKSGVYQKSKNATELGGHAVKLIGWGEENGTPYWLMMNSWGEYWGDKGLFKIIRGTNDCGVDNSTTAGVPIF